MRRVVKDKVIRRVIQVSEITAVHFIVVESDRS
jgi:hypothetical protein